MPILHICPPSLGYALLAGLALARSGAVAAEPSSGATGGDGAPSEGAPEAAEEVPPPAASGGSAALEKVALTHLSKLGATYWIREPFPEAKRVGAELEYRPRLTLGLEGVRLVLEPLIRACASMAELGESDFSVAPDRQVALVKEAFLRAQGGPIDFGVGWQIFSWGKADGFRPLDVFQAADLSDRIRDETLGVLSASVTLGGEEWTAEAVWVPWPVSSRVSYDPQNALSALPRRVGRLAVAANLADARRRDLADGELGVRMGYSGHLFDLAAVWARSWDRVPTSLAVSIGPGEGGASIAIVAPVFSRFTLWGAAIAVPLDAFVLRADAGLFLYDGAPAPYGQVGIRAVAGLERRIGFGNGLGSLFLILEYAFDQTAPDRLALVDGKLPSPFRIFRNALIGSASLDLGEKFRAELKGLVDLASAANLVRASATYRLDDGVSLSAGADAVSGSSRSLIGPLTGALRVTVGLVFHR